SLAGYQGALLAPTEILAKQHYESLKGLLKTTSLRVESYYSALTTAKKQEILKRLKEGDIDLIVGTHALFQEGVEFKNLGLAVADEQHRFGVEQRKKLLQKGSMVDLLLMSATPIPRTLANTLYGDMDVSTIETMPDGRKQVKTVLLQENSFRSVLPEIESQLQEGAQLYVVCGAIEEAQMGEVRTTSKVREALTKQFKGKAKVAELHGKMNSDEKEKVMKSFLNNDIQILVSTTVIEVGVNVVNATSIIIYDAHRFGLSQLHQLRGRVQRGNKQGNCYLLTDAKEPLSLQRLKIVEEETDGFKIAWEDLKMRGPGDLLGTRQSGLPAFLLGNLVEDTAIIETSKKDAAEILNNMDEKENQEIIQEILELRDIVAFAID
ncbi:MAG: ATP-dependent DNA helicase RecG, partial [Anaerorhabdus sp.]